jgi:hypothetical protein
MIAIIRIDTQSMPASFAARQRMPQASRSFRRDKPAANGDNLLQQLSDQLAITMHRRTTAGHHRERTP